MQRATAHRAVPARDSTRGDREAQHVEPAGVEPVRRHRCRRSDGVERELLGQVRARQVLAELRVREAHAAARRTTPSPAVSARSSRLRRASPVEHASRRVRPRRGRASARARRAPRRRRVRRRPPPARPNRGAAARRAAASRRARRAAAVRPWPPPRSRSTVSRQRANSGVRVAGSPLGVRATRPTRVERQRRRRCSASMPVRFEQASRPALSPSSKRDAQERRDVVARERARREAAELLVLRGGWRDQRQRRVVQRLGARGHEHLAALPLAGHLYDQRAHALPLRQRAAFVERVEADRQPSVGAPEPRRTRGSLHRRRAARAPRAPDWSEQHGDRQRRVGRQAAQATPSTGTLPAVGGAREQSA